MCPLGLLRYTGNLMMGVDLGSTTDLFFHNIWVFAFPMCGFGYKPKDFLFRDPIPQTPG